MPEPAHTDDARVVLSPLHLQNLHTHFRWNNDPTLNHFDSELPFEREPLRHFLPRFRTLIEQPDDAAQYFEIHVRAGDLVGVAFLDQIEPVHRRCHLGLTIGERDHWGRGYGREALRLLLRHAFEERHMHRVTASAFAYNEAWKRLLTAAGFRQEGCFRDHLYRDGTYWDKEHYALLAHEYAARQAPASQTADTPLRRLPAAA